MSQDIGVHHFTMSQKNLSLGLRGSRVCIAIRLLHLIISLYKNESPSLNARGNQSLIHVRKESVAWLTLWLKSSGNYWSVQRMKRFYASWSWKGGGLLIHFR